MIAAVRLLAIRPADALAAGTVIHSFVVPVMATLCALASIACAFFLLSGGVEYMASRGQPEGLFHAKRTIRNALFGLVLVFAAAALTAVLVHSYSSAASNMTGKLPVLAPVQADTSTSFWDIVVKAVVHVLRAIIQSIGQPFVQALAYFTQSTPLMGENSAVFNLWLVMVAIADGLFVLVVALIGFQVMSFATLGFDETDMRKLLPELGLGFLFINTSLFAIDGIIGLSNTMIHALQTAFPPLSLWSLLADMTQQSGSLGLGGLLLMVAFLILTVMLLVYYVGRLITLYIGAVLSPLVMLLYVVPAFRDFAMTAIKVYLTTIFVLFVQVAIMQLAASLFLGMLEGTDSGQPNTMMALIVGMATLIALLKTQGFMKELAYAASMPRAARVMAGTFMRGVSFVSHDERGKHHSKNELATSEQYRGLTTTRRPYTASGLIPRILQPAYSEGAMVSANGPSSNVADKV